MADLLKGITFDASASGKQVTAARLNSLVDAAIIQPGSITDRTEKTSPVDEDYLRIYDTAGSALKKVLLSNLKTYMVGVRPTFGAHRNGTNQTVTAQTWTKILFTTDSGDSGWDSNSVFDTTLARFTPGVAGYYAVDLAVGDPTGAATRMASAVYKNGALFRRGNYLNQSGNAVGAVTSILVPLNTTDYIEGYGLSSQTSIAGAITETYFSAVWVRPL